MAGGLPPPQVIVVHTGQVIVDEGIGMEHLYPATKLQSLLQLTAGCLTEQHGQDRADPLSSGHEAISHGLFQPLPLEAGGKVFFC